MRAQGKPVDGRGADDCRDLTKEIAQLIEKAG